jgi:hypothetical protein
MLNEMIPRYKFWQTNFPNLDTSKEGYPIPELYGQKTNIEPVCIDITTMQYQIAYREIKEIDTVEADGIDLAEDENYETDLTNARFTIYGMPYLTGGQTYILVFQGDFTINGADYVEVAGDSSAGYGNGQYYKIDGADNWTANAGIDLCFKIYGKKNLDDDEELVVEHDISNYDTDYPLRDAGVRSKIAQSFLMPADDYYITKIFVWVKKVNAPIDHFRLSILEDDQSTRVGGLTERKDVSAFGAAIALLQNKYYEFTFESDVRVGAKGYIDNFGDLINTHSGMLKHLWTEVLERDNSLLNAASFADLETEHPEPVCAYLDKEESFQTILERLEAGALFKFLPKLDGTWAVPFYETGVPSGTTHLKNEDFLSFSYLRDAKSIYYKVQILYNQDPITQEFKRKETTSDIAKYLYRRTGTLPIETYLKDASDANALADIYIVLFEVPQKKAIYSVSGYAFDALPTEKILISRDRADSETGSFDEVIFRYLKLTKSIATGNVNCEALLDELSY